MPVYIDVKYDADKEKYANNGEYKQLNGNIVVISPADTKDENDNVIQSQVTVTGSNNSNKLKDTDWFKANRQMPTAWQN